MLVGVYLDCVHGDGRTLSLLVAPVGSRTLSVEKGCWAAMCIHCSCFLIVDPNRPDISSLELWARTTNCSLSSFVNIFDHNRNRNWSGTLVKCKMADWHLWDGAEEPVFLGSSHVLLMLLTQKMSSEAHLMFLYLSIWHKSCRGTLLVSCPQCDCNREERHCFVNFWNTALDPMANMK